MKIICLYVEKFNCLREQLYNFSSDYRVSKDFSIHKYNSSLDLYFNFENITALVGINGSGKSSVIEVITKLLGFDEDVINASMVIEQNDKLYTLGDLDIFTYEHKPLQVASPRSKHPIEKSTILYSPVYNPHSYNKKLKNVLDYTNDGLFKFSRAKNRELDIKIQFEFLEDMTDFAHAELGFDRYMEIELKFPDIRPIGKKTFKLISEIVSRNPGDLFYAKEFLSNFLDDFNLLYKEKISLAEKQSLLIQLKKNIQEKFNDLNNEFQADYEALSVLEKAEISFLVSSFLSSLKINSKDSSDLEFMFLDIDSLLRANSLIRWVRSDLYVKKGFSHQRRPRFMDDIQQFKDILRMYRLNKSSLSFEPHESKTALDLLKNLRLSNLMKYNFQVGWRGISSGQVARLNLFSRLYSGIKQTRSNDITILLDEADTYLHPDWQRSFLFNLSSFLGRISENVTELKFYLILTTHSPLMISDLLKENVYVLENGNKKFHRAQNETFGANIFNLFEEEFFVAQVKGDLANKNIEILHDKIHREVLSHKEKKKIEMIIGKIGDPVIQIGLSNMMTEND